jgi:hypothetical protein
VVLDSHDQSVADVFLNPARTHVRHAIEKARRDRESAIAFVCRLMHLHQLPAVRVGPHWRFNHDSVDRWCDGRLARPR